MERSEQIELIPAQEITPTTPMELLRMATAAGADVDRLDKLMQLQERWLANERRQAYAADFFRMKPKLPKIIRRKHNEQTNSNYAPLEDINTQIDPVLYEFGFATSTKVISQTEAGVTVRAELWHKDGHVESTEIFMPLDRAGIKGLVNKTEPHALSSSVTYAKRVALCALLNISTGDDVDGNGQRVPSEWLDERLQWIASANATELGKIFADAWKKADGIKDKNAVASLIDAKNARKKELGL